MGLHHEPYTVPDYKIYKVESIPKLLETKKALEAQGLNDPWLRNEVWRYSTHQWGTENGRLKVLFGRGFIYGFGACIITLVASTAYKIIAPSKHGHDTSH